MFFFTDQSYQNHKATLDISRIKILCYIAIQTLWRLSWQNQFLRNIFRRISRWQAEIYRGRTDRWNATKYLRAECPPVGCECARPWNQGSRVINSAEDVSRERTFVLRRLSCFLRNVRACWSTRGYTFPTILSE